MPRGDGKQPGEKRVRWGSTEKTSSSNSTVSTQLIPDRLATRIADYELNIKGKKDTQGFKRPGSQKK